MLAKRSTIIIIKTPHNNSHDLKSLIDGAATKGLQTGLHNISPMINCCYAAYDIHACFASISNLVYISHKFKPKIKRM